MQWLGRLRQLTHNRLLGVGTRFKEMSDAEIANVERRKENAKMDGYLHVVVCQEKVFGFDVTVDHFVEMN